MISNNASAINPEVKRHFQYQGRLETCQLFTRLLIKSKLISPRLAPIIAFLRGRKLRFFSQDRLSETETRALKVFMRYNFLDWTRNFDKVSFPFRVMLAIRFVIDFDILIILSATFIINFIN